MTCVTSPAYMISKQPGPSDGKSFLDCEYRVGELTLPWGTPLKKM